jgi:hypothetical protein
MQEGRCPSLTVRDEDGFELLEPVGTETVQRASGQKECRRHAEFAQDGQSVLGVTRKIVIESHRDSGSLSWCCLVRPVLAQDFIQRDEVIDLAERLQLHSEHVDRYRRNNLAACWGQGARRGGKPERDGVRGLGEHAHSPIYDGRPQ